MWISFDIVSKNGNDFLRPESILFWNKKPNTETYKLKIEDYPIEFNVNDPFKRGLYHGLCYGWRNFPRWKFNITKYNQGENPFEIFDSLEDEWFIHQLRREDASIKINEEVLIATQIKVLRNLITDLYNQLGLSFPQDLQDFIAAIERVKLKIPKTQKIFKHLVDLYRERSKEKEDELQFVLRLTGTGHGLRTREELVAHAEAQGIIFDGYKVVRNAKLMELITKADKEEEETNG